MAHMESTIMYNPGSTISKTEATTMQGKSSVSMKLITHHTFKKTTNHMLVDEISKLVYLKILHYLLLETGDYAKS